MLFLDLFLRIGALSLFVVLAVLTGLALVRARKGRIQIMLLLACSLSLAGPLIVAMPAPYAPGSTVVGAANFIASPNIALVFLFCLSVFTEGFKFKLWHAVLLVVTWVVGFISRITMPVDLAWFDQLLNVVILVASGGLTVFLLVVLIHGIADDLIRSRRRGRLVVSVLLVLGSFVSIGSEWMLSEAAKNLFQAGLAAGFSLLGLVWLARIDPRALVFEANRGLPSKAESPDYARLIGVLESEQVYLEHGLTVIDLARRVGLPAHVLRDLITQGGGYRNFSSFINAWRIDHAKRRLGDPAQGELPILTIALDSGFASIAPFNRAFREQVGMTPSEYRRAKIDAD